MFYLPKQTRIPSQGLLTHFTNLYVRSLSLDQGLTSLSFAQRRSADHHPLNFRIRNPSREMAANLLVRL
jgi:hypothetical protein